MLESGNILIKKGIVRKIFSYGGGGGGAKLEQNIAKKSVAQISKSHLGWKPTTVVDERKVLTVISFIFHHIKGNPHKISYHI